MIIFTPIKRRLAFLTPLAIMAQNTLGEWSDGDDEWIWEIDESTFTEWSDPEADHIIRNIDESVFTERSNPEVDDIVQTGKKRKSDEIPEPEQDFYQIESTKKYYSKKFQMTATDHLVRFNNTLAALDLLESHERVQSIFTHLIKDVTGDMNERDKVRFVLRSDQLDTPISIPFMFVHQLTPERVFSQIERVVQSNREFRLNDTVIVDILHAEAQQGSGRSKRTTLNIREYLHKKRSVIVIRNNDNLCLARALVVAVARIEINLTFFSDTP